MRESLEELESSYLKQLEKRLSEENHKYGIAFGMLLNNDEIVFASDVSDIYYTPEKIEAFKQKTIDKMHPKKIIGPIMAENPNCKSYLEVLENDLRKENYKCGVTFEMLLDTGETNIITNAYNNTATSEEIEEFKKDIINRFHPKKIFDPYITDVPNYKSTVDNKSIKSNATSSTGCLAIILVPVVITIFLLILF